MNLRRVGVRQYITTGARADRRRRLPWLVTLLVAAGSQPAATHEPGIASVQGRDVLVLASAPDATQVDSAFGTLAAQAHDTSGKRVHVVSFEGETYRVSTPLQGPGSRIAFDPAHRSFVALLPSVRIPLTPGLRLDDVAAAVEARRVTAFESLGFAIVELPEEPHPADAVARLSRLPGPVAATLRLRAPQIRWR